MTKGREHCPINLDQSVFAVIDGVEECLTCASVPALRELLERDDLAPDVIKQIELALAIKKLKIENNW